jgi:predicted HD phosphohydrolase
MSDKNIHFTSLDQLVAFLERMAITPCAEPGLSELDHGLQCAEVLKVMRPDDVELQVAGLLHDIAHEGCPIRFHAEVGAQMLGDVMAARVCALIGLHVAAKRYLVTVQPDYLARLSPISQQSFALQGGCMDEAEVAAFEADPYRDDALLVREADDAAKVAGLVVPGLDAWRGALRQCANVPA